MTIYKYALKYYGIMIDKNIKISHKNIKKIIINIERCSFEYANSNIDLVNKGKIIYVEDSYGKILPYITPCNTYTKECGYLTISDDIKINNDNTFNINDINNLSTYILRILLSEYKNNRVLYTKIRNELIKRGIYNNKKYKLNKEINKLEESGLNDKYKRRRKIKCNKS